MISLVWLQRDLRLADHPALSAAVRTSSAVIPVYVHSIAQGEPWDLGSASRWWLHYSLIALRESLRSRGSDLVLRRADSILDELLRLVRAVGAQAVYWNRCYEPSARQRERDLEARLAELGIRASSFNGSLIYEPWEVASKTGGPYQVFSAFRRRTLALAEPRAVLGIPRNLKPPPRWPRSVKLDTFELLPRIRWADGLAAAWKPGSLHGKRRLERFLARALEPYARARNEPSRAGTSRLSPYLHFGEISPVQVWWRTRAVLLARDRNVPWRDSQYLTEILWREFAYHLLHHFPQTTDAPLRPRFAKFPWQKNSTALRAWQRGQTGYPIVDAGMRELWQTGWMHNRVRMIVASFLVKDLLIAWQDGARWFWDTLVDADLANNTLGWQWSAGSGADAAPYFRIFNPSSQGRKFDPRGAYVRKWVPEIAELPDRFIHEPWLASTGVPCAYPERIIDHPAARAAALRALRSIR